MKHYFNCEFMVVKNTMPSTVDVSALIHAKELSSLHSHINVNKIKMQMTP